MKTKEIKEKIIENLEEKDYKKIEEELEEIYLQEVELGERRMELEKQLVD